MSDRLDMEWRGIYALLLWVIIGALCMGILLVYSTQRSNVNTGEYDRKIIREKAEGNHLMWNGMPLEQVYDKAVVVEVHYSPVDEEILLTLTEKINEAFEGTDIMVYFVNGGTRSEQEILDLTQQAEADLFIHLGVGTDVKNEEMFGTKCYYNDVFFIPGYGNVQLADELLRNVVTNINGNALGLFECEEKSILRKMEIPAAEMVIGYQTNAKEGAMLSEEGYLELIAAGIRSTVEAYYAGE